MALKGKIDDFGIADIFQLIGQQQRTGILSIQSRNKVAEIFFVNGMISKVNPLYLSPKRNPLGDCIVKAKLMSEENLQRALKKQEETLKSLEEVLLDLQLLSQEQLQTVNEHLMFETLFDILQWKEGDYEFTLKEIEHDERFGSLMSIEHVILDVLRMVDEEPDLSRRIPNYNIIFQKASPEGIPAEEVNIEEEFGTYESIVYHLVDGANTVQAIVDQSLLGRHNTTKALVTLLDAGFITKKASLERGIPQKVLPPKKFITYIVYVGLPVIVMVLLVVWKLASKPPPPEDLALSSPKAALAKVQFLKIKNALNVYFLENGRFPGSLEELIKDQLIRPEELYYPSGTTYTYSLQADGSYRLE
ncbi:MAG: DUF4388 domain-containing protein [Pseudomonadota bacterium]